MKKIIEIQYKDPIDVILFDRTSLRSDLGRWAGQQSSQIGMPYIKLVDGIIVFHTTFAREDVLVIQYEAGNVFVTLDGEWGYSYSGIDGVELSDEENRLVRMEVRKNLELHHEFIQRQRAWFAQKQELLLAINGMTPNQAISYLESKDW